MSFLFGKALRERILDVCKGDNLRCAVAFWGAGATDKLQLGKRRDLEIVCDLTMGGTNPKELRALGAPRNAKLRHVPGLHSKVYLSERGVLTGSANASDNGVGFTSDARLIEAAIFAVAGSEEHMNAAQWFRELHKGADQIGSKDLEFATDLWARRTAAAITARTAKAPSSREASVLDLVIEHPEVFGECGFVIPGCVVPKAERENAVARDSKEVCDADLASYTQFSGSGWTRQMLRNWPNMFVELWAAGHSARAIPYRKVFALPKGDPQTVYAEKLQSGRVYDLVYRRKAPNAAILRKLLGRNQFFFQSPSEFRKVLLA